MWSKYRRRQQESHLKVECIVDAAIHRKALWVEYRRLAKEHCGRARRDLQGDTARLEAAIDYMGNKQLHVTWHEPPPDVGALYGLELLGKRVKFTWGRDRSADPQGLAVDAPLVMLWSRS